LKIEKQGLQQELFLDLQNHFILLLDRRLPFEVFMRKMIIRGWVRFVGVIIRAMAISPIINY
jgi:hypothetical protein